MAALNHKLVRFECQIVDMYEDEFFVSVMDPANKATEPDSKPLVYKYFSELSDAQVASYDLEADPSQMAGTLDRGNVLASSIIHLQPWASTGQCTSQGLQQKVLVKLYDSDRGSLKLNDTVTFVGVLEYTPSNEPPASQDSHMANFEDQGEE